MHQRLAEVTSERERRIAAACAEAEASAQAHMTFRPQLDGRSLRLAASTEAERAAAGGVSRPKEMSGETPLPSKRKLAYVGLHFDCELTDVYQHGAGLHTEPILYVRSPDEPTCRRIHDRLTSTQHVLMSVTPHAQTLRTGAIAHLRRR